MGRGGELWAPTPVEPNVSKQLVKLVNHCLCLILQILQLWSNRECLKFCGMTLTWVIAKDKSATAPLRLGSICNLHIRWAAILKSDFRSMRNIFFECVWLCIHYFLEVVMSACLKNDEVRGAGWKDKGMPGVTSCCLRLYFKTQKDCNLIIIVYISTTYLST